MNIRIRLYASELKDTSIHTISFGRNYLEREASKDHPKFLQMKLRQRGQNSSHGTRLLKTVRKTRGVLETLPWHFSGLGKTLDLFWGKFIRGSPTVNPKILPAGISAGDVIPLTTTTTKKQTFHKVIHNTYIFACIFKFFNKNFFLGYLVKNIHSSFVPLILLESKLTFIKSNVSYQKH